MRSSGSGAGADDRGRGFGAVGEDRGRVRLQFAVGAFGGEHASLGDRQVEALDRAAAAGDFRNRGGGQEAVATFLDLLDLLWVPDANLYDIHEPFDVYLASIPPSSYLRGAHCD